MSLIFIDRMISELIDIYMIYFMSIYINLRICHGSGTILFCTDPSLIFRNSGSSPNSGEDDEMEDPNSVRIPERFVRILCVYDFLI